MWGWKIGACSSTVAGIISGYCSADGNRRLPSDNLPRTQENSVINKPDSRKMAPHHCAVQSDEALGRFQLQPSWRKDIRMRPGAPGPFPSQSHSWYGCPNPGAVRQIAYEVAWGESPPTAALAFLFRLQFPVVRGDAASFNSVATVEIESADVRYRCVQQSTCDRLLSGAVVFGTMEDTSA